MKYKHEFIDWDQHLIKVSVRVVVQEIECFPFLPMDPQKNNQPRFLLGYRWDFPFIFEGFDSYFLH